jgi:hypothetical protein
MLEPVGGVGEIDADRPRLRAAVLLLPFRQLREKPGLVALGPPEARADDRRPGPAEAMQRLRRSPGPAPLRPVAAERRQQGVRRLAQESGGRIVARRRFEPERVGEALGGRHREARRMDEGEQLQEVEPAEVRIAEPAADERRVQHDHRRLGRPRDRRPAPDRFGPPVRPGDPDAAMGRVQSGVGEGRRHARPLSRSGTNRQQLSLAPSPP